MLNNIQVTLSQLGIFDIVLAALQRIFFIIFGALALVYAAGRYLEILKTDRSKNALGLISMFILSIIVIFWFDYKQVLLTLKFNNLEQFYGYVFSALFHFLFSIVIYAVVCWGFYDRIRLLINRKVPAK
ncbi:MAG TPA: hypothetical protein VF857_09585 [Spirochaetota bacterium]